MYADLTDDWRIDPEVQSTAWNGENSQNLKYPLPLREKPLYYIHTRDKRQTSPGGTYFYDFTNGLKLYGSMTSKNMWIQFHSNSIVSVPCCAWLQVHQLWCKTFCTLLLNDFLFTSTVMEVGCKDLYCLTIALLLLLTLMWGRL